MSMTPAMAAAFDNAQVGEYAESVPPPPGAYQVTVADAKLGEKDGEQYLVVELKEASGYAWSLFKWLTKGGQPHEGRIKSAKILLGQLGFPTVNAQTLAAVIAALPGKAFTATVSFSSQMNPTTGLPYSETVCSPAHAQPQAPVPAAAPPTGQFQQAVDQAQANLQSQVPQPGPAAQPGIVVGPDGVARNNLGQPVGDDGLPLPF